MSVFCSESAAVGGDALQYRYIVREIGQTSTSTVDACRVGSVAWKQLNYIHRRPFTVAFCLLVHFSTHLWFSAWFRQMAQLPTSA